MSRGTQYFREMVLSCLRSGLPAYHLLPDILFRSVAYRLMNKVETFKAFGGIPGPTQLEEFLGARIGCSLFVALLPFLKLGTLSYLN
jgi:hypothetical protein